MLNDRNPLGLLYIPFGLPGLHMAMTAGTGELPKEDTNATPDEPPPTPPPSAGRVSAMADLPRQPDAPNAETLAARKRSIFAKFKERVARLITHEIA